MALAGTGDALGDKIAAILTASDAPEEAKAEVKKLWRKIAGATIDHIVANAQVAGGIPVSTTGNAAAQTGVTTAPGSLL
jgi:hypothetical protein